MPFLQDCFSTWHLAETNWAGTQWPLAFSCCIQSQGINLSTANTCQSHCGLQQEHKFLAENEQMRIPVEKDVAMLPNYPRKTISQRNQKKRISYRLPDKSRPSNTWAVKNLALPERFLKIRFTICFKHFSSLIFRVFLSFQSLIDVVSGSINTV